MNPEIERLLARVLGVLAGKFKNRLVLKGGMQLRLLNSPRSTQDIDFILVSKESKKVLARSCRDAIESLGNVSIVKENLNSRGIFLEIAGNEARALVEISVLPATHLPPEPISTFLLSSRYQLAGQVISALAIPEAFSHKIAASIEREVMRDLYDITLFEPMGPFDVGTLQERLSRICIKREKPRSIAFHEAADLLRKRVEGLTENKLREELYPLVPNENRVGLLRLIQASVGRVVQRLEISNGQKGTEK